MHPTRPTLITLSPRHFSPPRGKAYPVTIRHPLLHGGIHAGTQVHVWCNNRWTGTTVETPGEVETAGDGRCAVQRESVWLPYLTPIDPGAKGVTHRLMTLWISLPADLDPREVQPALVIRLSDSRLAGGAPAAIQNDGGPLLIVGAQRSGTTALQVALDAATRYQAPHDINRYAKNTLEGNYFAQSTVRFLSHRYLSLFGEEASQQSLRTGTFDNSGFADLLLGGVADQINSAYEALSGARRTWIDKSPGWEPLAFGPLFRAMFRTGRIIYLSRDPVSSVLSISRLEGRGHQSISEQGAPTDIARNSAVWVMSHFIWRRYCRPILPSESFREVRFHALRDEPERTAPEIAGFLGLQPAEQRGFLAALAGGPVPRHPIDVHELDPAIPALIAWLCGREASEWNYRLEPGVTLEPQVLSEAMRIFRFRLHQMLTWFRFKPRVIERMIDHLCQQDSAPGAEVDPGAPPQAGPLLGALLARE